MERTGHSTNTTSGRHRVHQPQSQKLMDKEILELNNYLPEWTAAKRSEKQAIFTAIARAARLFAPKLDQKQWKKTKQVYKTWLFTYSPSPSINIKNIYIIGIHGPTRLHRK
ncbi:hypothetical protein EV424DRAFT_1348490 [Suillus variegatus]|nr:hypothetical protein EV424DRAFT_1348490 [Suillus variegatus]